MKYSDVRNGDRVRPIYLPPPDEQIHDDPGTVIDHDPDVPEVTYVEGERWRMMIRVQHDSGRVMQHTADQLETE